MNYYDGNTVTGLWNYAQHFAMSDNSFATDVRAVRAGSGQPRLRQHRQRSGPPRSTARPPTGHGRRRQGGASLIEDAQPYYDDCSTRDAVSLTGTNLGDELNAPGLSWGWFQGGFAPSTTFAQALADRHEPAHEHVHAGPVQGLLRKRNRPAILTRRCATRSTRSGIGSRRRNGQYGNKDDYIAAPRAVPVLRLDGQPAPPGAGVAGGDRHRHAVVRERVRSSTRPTTSTT